MFSPPRNDRVIVFDCARLKLEVLKLEEGEFRAYKLAPREDYLVFYLDYETRTELRTEHITDGQVNVLLAILHLDRLGLMNRILRFTGHLSTLYAYNIPVKAASSKPESSTMS
ncbi:MAG: hypothetical protein FRX48_01934 [Lasallia pustulata]|uniref:Uncharacterized protein n=1 Tax=Lasallia pustulata TaxID=136370 RepID=A0A5M8PZI3_9LECA|nr:MAG: hypothetical protein FRX48_01934 [Lasallia pustulata]